MTPLDHIADGGQLQLLKLLLPCLTVSQQPFMALLIKVMEIRNLQRYFRNPMNEVSGKAADSPSASSLLNILTESPDCLPSPFRTLITQIGPITEMMQMFRAMSESDDDSVSDSENKPFHENAFSETCSIPSAMLSPEQQDLFEKYSKLFEESEEMEERKDE